MGRRTDALYGEEGLDMSPAVIVLLLVAGVVAMVARRLKFPYSVALVVAGIALVFLPLPIEIHPSTEWIYNVLLPPLLFEAAFYLRWKRLKRELPLVLTLAVFGVVLGGGVTALAMHWLVGWPWATSFVFGALISATDPVSVLATFRQAKSQGRLALLIESESLLNDGVAAVLFVVALSAAVGKSASAPAVVGSLLVAVAGALVCGAAVAGAALLLIGYSNDHLVELTFTTIAAWGSFLLAEHFHASGVLSCIVAGLMMGNLGPMKVISHLGRDAIHTFWEFAAFLANSLIFLLIGLFLAGLYRERSLLAVWWVLPVAILVTLVARGLSVYPLCLIFRPTKQRVTANHQHALVWGGLRGALALALALGLPESLPGRSNLVETSFAIVAFSIFVQGLTMPLLLRKIGEIPANAGE